MTSDNSKGSKNRNSIPSNEVSLESDNPVPVEKFLFVEEEQVQISGSDHEKRTEVAVDPLPEVVYSAESVLRHPGSLLRAMFRDLAASRELAWRLFIRDLSAQYRLSYFGYFWVLVPPLATMSVWVFLNRQGIMNVGNTPVPYPVYVLTGLLLWESFAAALNSPLQVVRDAAAMLTKINFPREALLVAGFGHVLFNTMIRLVLLAGFFLWYGVSVPITAIFVPVGVVSLLLLGSTIGLLLVPIGMLYQDIGRGLAMLTTFWFFLTPVVYPPPEKWPASLLNSTNPVSPLLLTTREALTTGDLTRIGEFLVVSAVTFGLLVVAWVGYRLALPHIIARMSA